MLQHIEKVVTPKLIPGNCQILLTNNNNNNKYQSNLSSKNSQIENFNGNRSTSIKQNSER